MNGTVDFVARKVASNPLRLVAVILLCSTLLYGYYIYRSHYFPIGVVNGPLSRASPELAKTIKSEIAVVILTSSPTISIRLRNLMDSWVPYWKENTYWFSDGDLSKVSNFPQNWTSNYVNTGCDDQYTTGLLCKNVRMVVTFQQPEFMHYKWVLRVMDDTWVHMENLYELVSGLDSAQAMAIGERYCHPRFSYLTGGPGFVLSRGLINNFNFGKWHEITRRRAPSSVFDDLVWGQYLQETKTRLVHHHGFSQLSASLDNSMFNYIVSRRKWSLPFRPIAYHQGPTHFDIMPHLEEALHRLPYDKLDKKMVVVPDCKCWNMTFNEHEVRCTPKASIRRQSACGNGLKSISCLTGSNG